MSALKNRLPRVILASRSPRRRELLQLLVPAEVIEVLPPRDAREAGFDGLSQWPAIERRLAEIARAKAADVVAQLGSFDESERPSNSPLSPLPPAGEGLGVRGQASRGSTLTPDPSPIEGEGRMRFPGSVIIAADTVIVAQDLYGVLHVLGQPTEDGAWQRVVRTWFRDYYAGRPHAAVTAVCLKFGDHWLERVVRTDVTFKADLESNLEWYLATGEPRGKAGGYAIQGAGSVFVESVEGSLSNVVGLPLEALIELFAEAGIHVRSGR